MRFFEGTGKEQEKAKKQPSAKMQDGCAEVNPKHSSLTDFHVEL